MCYRASEIAVALVTYEVKSCNREIIRLDDIGSPPSHTISLNTSCIRLADPQLVFILIAEMLFPLFVCLFVDWPFRSPRSCSVWSD